jgi:hypothetical protein
MVVAIHEKQLEKSMTKAQLHYAQLIAAIREKTRRQIADESPKDFIMHSSTVQNSLPRTT